MGAGLRLKIAHGNMDWAQGLKQDRFDTELIKSLDYLDIFGAVELSTGGRNLCDLHKLFNAHVWRVYQAPNGAESQTGLAIKRTVKVYNHGYELLIPHMPHVGMNARYMLWVDFEFQGRRSAYVEFHLPPPRFHEYWPEALHRMDRFCQNHRTPNDNRYIPVIRGADWNATDHNAKMRAYAHSRELTMSMRGFDGFMYPHEFKTVKDEDIPNHLTKSDHPFKVDVFAR